MRRPGPLRVGAPGAGAAAARRGRRSRAAGRSGPRVATAPPVSSCSSSGSSPSVRGCSAAGGVASVGRPAVGEGGVVVVERLVAELVGVDRAVLAEGLDRLVVGVRRTRGRLVVLL